MIAVGDELLSVNGIDVVNAGTNVKAETKAAAEPKSGADQTDETGLLRRIDQQLAELAAPATLIFRTTASATTSSVSLQLQVQQMQQMQMQMQMQLQMQAALQAQMAGKDNHHQPQPTPATIASSSTAMGTPATAAAAPPALPAGDRLQEPPKRGDSVDSADFADVNVNVEGNHRGTKREREDASAGSPTSSTEDAPAPAEEKAQEVETAGAETAAPEGCVKTGGRRCSARNKRGRVGVSSSA